jgi:ankyrin repeat protein
MRTWLVGFSAVCLGIVTLVAAGETSGIADAARRGDKATVRQLLSQKIDVNQPLGDGTTALHWAAYNDDVDTAALLLAAGANLQAVTRDGALTPLMVAAANGSASVVDKLLTAGANPNLRSADGATALMTAAASGNAAAVSALLAHGADIDAKDSARGETPLMFAAAANQAAVVTVLMNNHADAALTSNVVKLTRPAADLTGRRAPVKGDPLTDVKAARRARANAMGGMTALHFASRNGQLDAARALVQAGADVNQLDEADHSTPLIMAVDNGHFDLAKFLLESGADVNRANDDGLTPLYATVETQYAHTSWSPTRSTEQQRTTHLQLMTDLLARGADPNARLKRKLWFRPSDHDDAWVGTVGTTPFWRAAMANDVDAMRLLYSKGADPNVASSERVSPLMAAAGLGWLPMVKVVPNARIATVEVCLELGAKLNETDMLGYTPLHGAAYLGDDELVKFLVAKGAPLDAKTIFGTSITDMANGFVAYTSLPRPHPETVALLQKLGAPKPSPERVGESAYCDAQSLNCPLVSAPR